MGCSVGGGHGRKGSVDRILFKSINRLFLTGVCCFCSLWGRGLRLWGPLWTGLVLFLGEFLDCTFFAVWSGFWLLRAVQFRFKKWRVWVGLYMALVDFYLRGLY